MVSGSMGRLISASSYLILTLCHVISKTVGYSERIEAYSFAGVHRRDGRIRAGHDPSTTGRNADKSITFLKGISITHRFGSGRRRRLVWLRPRQKSNPVFRHEVCLSLLLPMHPFVTLRCLSSDVVRGFPWSYVVIMPIAGIGIVNQSAHPIIRCGYTAWPILAPRSLHSMRLA